MLHSLQTETGPEYNLDPKTRTSASRNLYFRNGQEKMLYTQTDNNASK